VGVLAENGHTDRILFEVQHQAVDVPGELHHLTGHHVLQAVDAGDTVTYLKDGSDTLNLEVAVVIVQLLG